eukprot:gene6541-10547_t
MQLLSGRQKYFVSYGLAILGFIIPTFHTIFGIKEENTISTTKPTNEEQFSWKKWFIENVLKSFYFPFETYHTFYAISFCTLFIYTGFYLIGPYFQYFLKEFLEYRMPVISSAVG